MTEWKEYKLGEIAEIVGGGTPDTSNKEYWGGNIPWLTPKDLTGYNKIFISSGERFITEEGLDNSSTKLLPQGTVLLSSRAPIGYVAIASNPICTNQGFKSIICNKDIVDNLYMYYWIKNNTELLQSLGTGTTFAEISGSVVKSIAISLPPLPEQICIASILSSLDDKIDLLHRENKTLEAMAETLFRQWFIEEAKEDWKEVSLEYVCERITDGSHYSPESVESGLPMASVKDMEDWGINLNSCRKISKEEFDKLVSADCLPQVNDILIAKDGSYLKHIFVVNKMQEVVILSSIAIIRPNGLYHPYLLSLLLKLDSIKEELKNIVTGAVIPRIVLKDFRKFPIILPPKEKQEKALLFIEPIMKKCFYNREQIQTLIQQRDSLLPKLMSGEVKI